MSFLLIIKMERINGKFIIKSQKYQKNYIKNISINSLDSSNRECGVFNFLILNCFNLIHL